MRLLIPSETGIIGDIPVLVAMVAAGLDESLSPRGAIRQALEIDPFSFGEGRAMVRRIHQFLDLADRGESDRELALMVSRAVQGINPHRSIERRFKENGSYPRAAADLLRWRSISG